MSNPYAAMAASQRILARELLKDEIEALIAAEREACAKIADAEISASESCDLEADHNSTARNIAAAIRARKGTP